MESGSNHVTVVGDPSAIPPLDPEVIESLRELIDDDDPDFLTDLLEGFLENARDNISKIAEAADSGEADMMGQIAHTIKGSSRNVGANILADISFELEIIGKRGNTEGAANLISNLETEYTRVKAEIEKIM